MEFRFNLNDIFKEPIVEIDNNFIPPGFKGDKRALWDTQAKVSQLVNAMGEASATAQGLSKPITTSDRLRNSEHKLYFLIDQSANSGKGAVTGMLKIGQKGLYVFDREGHHYQVTPPCILDFYVHESRQRQGLGKHLFEHMLQKVETSPVKMAIDRPSDKFLAFLEKHYGLNSPVKQMNNYVVFDEFFPKSREASPKVVTTNSITPSKKSSANGLQHNYQTSPYGRYGAPRPACSMGQIIHNETSVIQKSQEATGVRSEPLTNVQTAQHNYSYPVQPQTYVTQSTPNMPYNQNLAQQEYHVNHQNYNVYNEDNNQPLNQIIQPGHENLNAYNYDPNQQTINPQQDIDQQNAQPQQMNQYPIVQTANEHQIPQQTYQYQNMPPNAQPQQMSQQLPTAETANQYQVSQQTYQYQDMPPNAQPQQMNQQMPTAATTNQYEVPQQTYKYQNVPSNAHPQQMNQQLPTVQTANQYQAAQQTYQYQNMLPAQQYPYQLQPEQYVAAQSPFATHHQEIREPLIPAIADSRQIPQITHSLPNQHFGTVAQRHANNQPNVYQQHATRNVQSVPAFQYQPRLEHHHQQYPNQSNLQTIPENVVVNQPPVSNTMLTQPNLTNSYPNVVANPQATNSIMHIQPQAVASHSTVPGENAANAYHLTGTAPPPHNQHVAGQITMNANSMNPPTQQTVSNAALAQQTNPNNQPITSPQQTASNMILSPQNAVSSYVQPTYSNVNLQQNAANSYNQPAVVNPMIQQIVSNPTLANQQYQPIMYANQPSQANSLAPAETVNQSEHQASVTKVTNVASGNVDSNVTTSVDHGDHLNQRHGNIQQMTSQSKIFHDGLTSKEGVSESRKKSLTNQQKSQYTMVSHDRSVENLGHIERNVPDVHAKGEKIMRKEDRQRPTMNTGELPFGYPPQTNDTKKTTSAVTEGPIVHRAPPKLDRPNSLSIHTDEEKADIKHVNDIDNDHDDCLNDDEIDQIEEEIRKVEIATEESQKSRNVVDKSPTPEHQAAGKSTPGLTGQGFVDLKFYHNKLW